MAEYTPIAIPRAGQMTAARFMLLREKGYADFTQRLDAPTNHRMAKCRVCGERLYPHQGRGYDEYMTDGYRFTRRYVCGGCETVTRPTAALRRAREG